MRTIHRTIVSAILFSRDHKILMGAKDVDSGGVYADCWHIPGGGIDEGETKEEALCREVMEEVGIDISSYQKLLVDTMVPTLLRKYLELLEKKYSVICSLMFIG